VALLGCVLVVLLRPQPSLQAADSPLVLTNAADVLALSADQAWRGIAISVSGVVTAAEQNWGGRFFVQDASGGVFVENISSVQPQAGDLVTVSGVSYPGGYAPIISKPQWTKTGTAPLPNPKVVAIEQLMSGNEDGQRVEIRGIIRSAQVKEGQLQSELVSGGCRVRVYSRVMAGLDPQSLVGAAVRVRGTAAATYNAPLRHALATAVYAPFPDDFAVDKPAVAAPFDGPLTPINSVGQYRSGRSPGERVHVKGVVTYQRPGEDVFIGDAGGGLQIKSQQTLALSPGDQVEAVGFPELESFMPVLKDAVLRKSSEGRAEKPPAKVPIEEVLEGLHHADYVVLQGKLLDRLVKGAPASLNSVEGAKTILVIQTSNLVFTAETESVTTDPRISSIPIGSLVEARGICFLQSGEDGKIKSFQLLLPGPGSVRLLAEPSWLTPRHLIIVLGIAFAIILVGASWIIMVSKKNSTLRQLILQRELDRKELQQAHDMLEWTVKQRTAQLKCQISARKEAQVQFRATLAERTRLAKELHDTLEQMLIGISLQLKMVAKFFTQAPDAASHHLGLVRNMVRMSRVDLHRSIWDLRSRQLEKFDLAQALAMSGNQIAEGAGIQLQVQTLGAARPLPEVVEENLLRIGQEALTNAVKHSGARHARIALGFDDKSVSLEISDDGTGFAPDHCAGPNEGHFGLQGMSERAKRLGGQLAVTSAPGKGTRVKAQIPIETTLATTLGDEPSDHE
jgi:signal transduction histidine kinase